MKIKKLIRVMVSALAMCLMSATFTGCITLPSWLTNLFHEHTYTVTEVQEACVNSGWMTYTCSCGDTYSEEIPATGEHKWGEASITAPTCVEEGHTVKTCTVCGAEDDVVTPATGVHTWGEPIVTDATCTEGGSTKKICTVCEAEDLVTSDPLDHDWIKGVPTIMENGETLCEFGGMSVDICKRCMEVEAHPVAPTGHTVSVWDVQAEPTTSKTGKITGVCDTCGGEVSQELPKLNKTNYAYTLVPVGLICNEREVYDSYSIWVNTKGELNNKEAEGLQAFNFRVRLDAVAHTLKGKLMTATQYDADEWAGYITEISGYKATCAQPGKGVYQCEVEGCGEFVEVVTTRKHTWDVANMTITQEPTCTTAGVGTVPCSKDYCTATRAVTATESPKLGHDHVYALEEVNGGEDGKYSKDSKVNLITTCNRCTYKNTKDVTKTAKNNFATAATCREEWTLVYTYKSGVIDVKLELVKDPYYHILNGTYMDKDMYPVGTEGINTLSGQAPTDCETYGSGVYECGDCKEPVQVTLKKGHEWVETVVTAPTCEGKGSQQNICSVCGEKEAAKAMDAVGHNMVVELLTAPTKDTKGKVKLSCTACDKKEEKEIPVLGNSAYTKVLKDGIKDDCENAATYVYTLDVNKCLNLKDETYVKWPALTVTFEVVVDDVVHNYDETTVYQWEVTIEDKTYKCKGYYCANCQTMKVIEAEEITANTNQ